MLRGERHLRICADLRNLRFISGFQSVAYLVLPQPLDQRSIAKHDLGKPGHCEILVAKQLIGPNPKTPMNTAQHESVWWSGYLASQEAFMRIIFVEIS